MERLLEIACFNPAAAITAAAAGAHRIELCENYHDGGITPCPEIISYVRANIAIPLHVIIRPRPGDFVYPGIELSRMKKDIEACRKLGIDGVVFGVLTKHGTIDQQACRELLHLAGGMHSTFHRAIDQCEEIEHSVASIAALGFKSVLTSGGAATAMQGAGMLAALQKKFGSHIHILPGGGVRSSNLEQLIHRSGCTHYHSAAITGDTDSPDAEEIKKLLTILHKP